MDKSNLGLLISKRDVAAMLDVSEKTVSRLINAGELPVVQIGRIKRIEVSQLHEFVERKRTYNRPRVELDSVSITGAQICNFTKKGTASTTSPSRKTEDALDALLKRKAS